MPDTIPAENGVAVSRHPEPGRESNSAGATGSASSDARQLRFDRITKRYHAFEAVKDFNLDVRGGEFLTLLGPSGSGKTTVLSMVAGFQEPTSGELYLGNERLDRLAPERRNIGMVFQSYALFPHMTVERNVAFPLKMRGVRRQDLSRRVARALELVQLEAHAQKYPSQLSGGQQQRAALARALVFEPSVLLMDEPLGALDRRLREAVQFELVNLHRQIESTIVYVTHDQDEALTMSDRIAIMNEGRIEQVGTPREIYEAPTNAFVAKFMGESAEFRGEVVRIGGGTCLVRCNSGELVGARATASLKDGDQVVVIVRPERLRLTRSAGEGVSAKVTDLLYMGQRSRYTVVLGDGSVLDLIRENTVGGETYVAGETVALQWEHDDAVALP